MRSCSMHTIAIDTKKIGFIHLRDITMKKHCYTFHISMCARMPVCMCVCICHFHAVASMKVNRCGVNRHNTITNRHDHRILCQRCCQYAH